MELKPHFDSLAMCSVLKDRWKIVFLPTVECSSLKDQTYSFRVFMVSRDSRKYWIWLIVYESWLNERYGMIWLNGYFSYHFWNPDAVYFCYHLRFCLYNFCDYIFAFTLSLTRSVPFRCLRWHHHFRYGHEIFHFRSNIFGRSISFGHFVRLSLNFLIQLIL